MRLTNQFIAILLTVVCVTSTRAAERKIHSDAELALALKRAQAGDTIKIAAGNYRGGIEIRGLQGTASKPILITADDDRQKPIIDGGSYAFHLIGCNYLILRSLKLTGATGNCLNIDDGGPANERSVGIRLEGLTIVGTSPKGNLDGIKLSGLDDLSITNCLIKDWGRGGSGIDMVGCHASRVSGCNIDRYDRGDAANETSNAIQMKGGCEQVQIEDCVVYDIGGRGINLGGSTGKEYFRPLDSTAEARDLSVRKCVFLGCTAAVAFVGADGATVEDCILYRPNKWALRILQENRSENMATCRNGVFQRNVVIFDSSQMQIAVNVGDATDAASFRFIDNQWYCEDDSSHTQRFIRLPSSESNGLYGQKPDEMVYSRVAQLNDAPHEN